MVAAQLGRVCLIPVAHGSSTACLIPVAYGSMLELSVYFTYVRKKRGKKDKSTDRKTRAGSTADFDFSEESIEQLARQFGISETKIRQMGTHSGKIDAPAAVTTATEQDYEDDQEEDESSDDDSIIQTRSQV